MATFDIDLHDANGSSAFDNNDVKVSDVKFSRRRQLSTNIVPRSDFSIIEFDKLEPMRISLKGTVAGTNWDSMLANWTDFKEKLNSGKLKFYLDANRFAEVIASDYSEEFIGIQDFMKFGFNLIAKNPYFQDAVTTVYTTTPVGTANFTISNDGDVVTPTRIEISNATSTINDNLQLENLTNSSIFLYHGTLAIGTTVEIDRGVQTYQNFRVQTNAADVFKDFEGDLFVLEVGTNTFRYTGQAGTQIKLSYRKMYG